MATTLERALVAMGNRDEMSSAELIWRLDPDYQKRHGSRATAGYVLSKELGVKPHRFFDPVRGRYASVYHRADLEAARPTLKPYRPVLDWQKQYGMTDESEAELQSRPPYRHNQDSVTHS